MSSRRIRKLLIDLASAGMLVDYSLHMRFGQTVMVRLPGGRPKSMRLGTAEQMLRSLARG